MNRLNLIGGVAVGAGIVYFFDGALGKRRRNHLAHRMRVLIGRPPVAKSGSWEMPMATVNIDIDQGTVTLRGAFPPSDAPQTGTRSHRGVTRDRGHAEARPGFDGSAQG